LPRLASNLDPPDLCRVARITGANHQHLASFFDRVYVAQSGLELKVLLPLPPKCWDYRHAPQHLAVRYILLVACHPPNLG
jgi:hypothetical protein